VHGVTGLCFQRIPVGSDRRDNDSVARFEIFYLTIETVVFESVDMVKNQKKWERTIRFGKNKICGKRMKKIQRKFREISGNGAEFVDK